jgi:hypothetical protein
MEMCNGVGGAYSAKYLSAVASYLWPWYSLHGYKHRMANITLTLTICGLAPFVVTTPQAVQPSPQPVAAGRDLFEDALTSDFSHCLPFVRLAISSYLQPDKHLLSPIRDTSWRRPDTSWPNLRLPSTTFKAPHSTSYAYTILMYITSCIYSVGQSTQFSYAVVDTLSTLIPSSLSGVCSACYIFLFAA